MSRPLHIPLLCTLAVVLYLPALPSPPFVFDDLQTLHFIREGVDSFWSNLLHSGSSRYFRPMIRLSFLLDLYLWDLDPAMVRLGNVALHAANATLLLLIARKTVPARDELQHLPLLLAAVFVAYPLATESINWISGRTDPLACFFTLLGVFCIEQLLKKGRLASAWLAAGFILLGALAKEVAFFILPGFLAYLLIMPRRGRGLRWRLGAALPFALGMLLYLAGRWSSIQGQDQGIDQLVRSVVGTDNGHATAGTLLEPLITLVRAFGFYSKKLLIPMPLNFAIDNVSSSYLYLGIVALLIVGLTVLRRDRLALMLLLAAATIAPALLNAVAKIAWTAYAERYLYLPAALFLLALGHLACGSARARRLVSALLVLALVTFLPVTVQRNQLWAKPAELLATTLQSSPANVDLRNNYATTLAANGRLDEARRQLLLVLAQDPDNSNARYNLPMVSFMSGDIDRAGQEFDRYLGGLSAPGEKIKALKQKIEMRRLETSGVPVQQE
jgi:tetratricopeptide (TPR) repeat protein